MGTVPSRRVGLLSLSLALYPGAILWGFQLWVSYGLVNVSCGHGFDPMFHLVSLFFAVPTALSALLAFRIWRGIRAGLLLEKGVPGRARFMALCGMVANTYFAFLIVIGGVPSFVLNPCAS